jgi:hypothetical protein
MKVGDLVTWRKEAPRRRGERGPKGYGLVIGSDMMGHLGEQRLWLLAGPMSMTNTFLTRGSTISGT